ncbi:hypothetical protein D9758_014000 [Tetrapyrgos nigripes]|uniref:Bacteriophage T5 Orf172 DNA-binding domain-containing protein n=1 Tax=Tetrapyrgos nigripes TaxID=182062 RepID=A0A8H5LJL1_9AGAR|nr:hypothetical protein D9758_014000 [Tetrapyrgos nigripes]
MHRQHEREPLAAIVTYLAPGRTFERLLKEDTLAEIKQVVRIKLDLADDVPIHLAQQRGERVIDLEDEEDFEAFCVAARRSGSMDVRVIVLSSTNTAKYRPTQRVTSGINYWLYDPHTHRWKYGATTWTADQRCDQINSQCGTHFQVVVHMPSNNIFATERFAHALLRAWNLQIVPVRCHGCEHVHRELFNLGVHSEATVRNATQFMSLAIASGVL